MWPCSQVLTLERHLPLYRFGRKRRKRTHKSKSIGLMNRKGYHVVITQLGNNKKVNSLVSCSRESSELQIYRRCIVKSWSLCHCKDMWDVIRIQFKVFNTPKYFLHEFALVFKNYRNESILNPPNQRSVTLMHALHITTSVEAMRRMVQRLCNIVPGVASSTVNVYALQSGIYPCRHIRFV